MYNPRLKPNKPRTKLNKPRSYSKNYTGISICQGQGQINISKICMEVLGHPQSIAFKRLTENPDWLYLIPDNEHLSNGLVADIQYRDPYNMANAYIASKDVVDSIYDMFGIKRNDPTVFSPFYMMRQDWYHNQPCVRICMNHFDKYRDG